MAEEDSILEQPFMNFPPFGADRQGKKICDIAGNGIKAAVECLYDCVNVKSGAAKAEETVKTLCCRLNELIPDKACEVTPESLRNEGNSYSMEFNCRLRDLCRELSGDPNFHLKAGARAVYPSIQALLRPDSISQIYKRWTSVGCQFASPEVLQFGIQDVTWRSAIVWMQFTDKALRQFGPYRKSCIKMICDTCKGGFDGAQRQIHGAVRATARHIRCVADGHPRCEWECSWAPAVRIEVSWFWLLLISTATLASLLFGAPSLSMPWMFGLSFIPPTCMWLAMTRLQNGQTHKLETRLREKILLNDRLQEKFREAAQKYQSMEVEYNRTIVRLTALNQAVIACSSIFDRERLIQEALSTVVNVLHHEGAMFVSYDQQRQVIHGIRLLGVRPEITRFAEPLEVPVTDPLSLEARVFLQGEPILIDDIVDVLDQMDRRFRELAERLGTQSFISVPLKIEDRVLGAITVDRTCPYALSEDDMKAMITLASQLAVAFERLASDERREALTTNLEEQVRDRTAQLESANTQLKQISEMKTQFVSEVFHDLSQSMAAIRGIAENILDRVAGPINKKQAKRLERILSEADRVMNRREALLWLAKIESDVVPTEPVWILLEELVETVAESFSETLHEKSIMFDTPQPAVAIRVEADRTMLTKILSNLIENAIKFTPRGGTIQVLTSIQSDGFVCVRVTDTGCGIAPDDIPKVFDRFFRGSSFKRTIPGSGLGLAIVKRLAELHGGTIGVESQIGEGSSFLVLLPVRQSSSSPGAT